MSIPSLPPSLPLAYLEAILVVLEPCVVVHESVDGLQLTAARLRPLGQRPLLAVDLAGRLEPIAAEVATRRR